MDTELTEGTRDRINWAGEGWFRLRLRVDPDVPKTDVGLFYRHYGALAIYLDGLLIHTSGQVASHQHEEEVYFVHSSRQMFELPLTPGTEHVLAVRFSNHYTLGMFDPPEHAGFRAALVDAPAWRQLAPRFLYSQVWHQSLFVVPFGFGILHLLLFLYHRQRLGHLYYALFALSVAGLIYTPLHVAFVHTPWEVSLLRLGFKWSLVAAPLTGLLFLYTEFHGRTSILFKGACVLGGILVALALVVPVDVIYYFTLLMLLDVMRLVFGLRRDIPGARVVRVGWFLFAAGCLLQVLIELDLVELPVSTDDAFGFFPYIYGTLILVVSMSVYLARAVAITNKELAAQLEQVRDLSARAADHEREVQSAKLPTLTHLMAGIVHEMNSPIGAIRSARDTLSRAIDKLRDHLPQGPALQAIDSSTTALESATDRLHTIVGGFRSFSHLDEAEWQIARVEEGLDSALVIMESELGAVVIAREYGGTPAIWCAPARLNQVFLHLITNALTAIEEAGTIALRTWTEEEVLCISISDSGQGIAAEDLDGLFDVSFRRSDRVKMGLGLVADSHTISEHGGQMQVRSEVGVGTEVVVQLPLRSHQ